MRLLFNHQDPLRICSFSNPCQLGISRVPKSQRMPPVEKFPSNFVVQFDPFLLSGINIHHPRSCTVRLRRGYERKVSPLSHYIYTDLLQSFFPLRIFVFSRYCLPGRLLLLLAAGDTMFSRASVEKISVDHSSAIFLRNSTAKQSKHS